jgi:hypothetical protein
VRKGPAQRIEFYTASREGAPRSPHASELRGRDPGVCDGGWSCGCASLVRSPICWGTVADGARRATCRGMKLGAARATVVVRRRDLLSCTRCEQTSVRAEIHEQARRISEPARVVHAGVARRKRAGLARPLTIRCLSPRPGIFPVRFRGDDRRPRYDAARLGSSASRLRAQKKSPSDRASPRRTCSVASPASDAASRSRAEPETTVTSSGEAPSDSTIRA